MKALFIFLLFVAATQALSTLDECSTKMRAPDLCGSGKTCDYKADKCKIFSSTDPGTCLNDNKVIDKRPALLESSKVAIFKLSVNNPTGSTGKPSPRNLRCGLDKNKFIKPNDLQEAKEEDKTKAKLARAAIEILDAIFWLSDLQSKQGICQTMIRFTISIAQMNDGEIYLAGNLDFSSINQNPKSTWKTFMLETPGVKLAILYILKKWEFSTDKVFVLTTTKRGKEYMRRHAEMQLVRFAKEKNKDITALGVSKPPCCLCDEALTAPAGDYRLTHAMEVFSGPGTQKCGVTAIDAPWCGHQYGAHNGEQNAASWNQPNAWNNNEYVVTKITL
eukprot:GFUD01088471.1.p1 GENE.GFUD01088471.1~~GFUD01088471.1.p1  ORF type:complete len:333 (+),score=64.24 GFUD01088471.1:190-1188(+)